MNRFVFCSFLSCLVLPGTILARSAPADVKLPSVLGSHMVLQRDKPLPIWGQAEPHQQERSACLAVPDQGRDRRHWRVTEN